MAVATLPRQPDSDAHKSGTGAGPTGRRGRNSGSLCPGPLAGRGESRCPAGWPLPTSRRAPLEREPHQLRGGGEREGGREEERTILMTLELPRRTARTGSLGPGAVPT